MLPPLKSFDTKGLVIYLGTFSKVFCPGMRIGWVAADEDILEKYILVKQGADLHSSGLTQRNISMYMDEHDLDADVEKLREVYRSRRNAMLAAMAVEFPEYAKYTHPDGGLFTWVELPEGMDTAKLLQEGLKNNVAFVPGGSFFPNGGGRNTMRLNFSNMPEDRIREGIKRLARIIRANADVN
jgi:DNA-binding transcriptional MocR family regulator